MKVALHPEGVDRNVELIPTCALTFAVALHPEGVDRNQNEELQTWRLLVALHPEGVDRNLEDHVC